MRMCIMANSTNAWRGGRADGTPQGCEACHKREVMGRREWFRTIRKPSSHCSERIALPSAGDCHKVPAGKKENPVQGQRRKFAKDCHKKTPMTANSPRPGKENAFVETATIRKRWAPSTFNHDTRDAFPPCRVAMQAWLATNAIKQTRMVDAKPVIIYKQAPIEVYRLPRPRTSAL